MGTYRLPVSDGRGLENGRSANQSVTLSGGDRQEVSTTSWGKGRALTILQLKHNPGCKVTFFRERGRALGGVVRAIWKEENDQQRIGNGKYKGKVCMLMLNESSKT